MDTRTKKRIRARMARTGESYQAARNAMHGAAKDDASPAAFLPKPHPFDLACDICGESVLEAPEHALIAWFYLPDSREPLTYVAGLYIAHKGGCDDVVELFAMHMGRQTIHWVDLIGILRDDWYAATHSLLSGKRWCPSHEERLTFLFRRISAARERGWRPPTADGYHRHGPVFEPQAHGSDAAVDHWVRTLKRNEILHQVNQRERLLAGLAISSPPLRAKAIRVFEHGALLTEEDFEPVGEASERAARSPGVDDDIAPSLT